MLPLRLKELRKQRHISQRDLADKLQVAQQTIGGWETGRTEPNNELLSKVADFFGVTVDYLLGRTDDRHEEVLAAAHLNKDLKDMTPEQRQAVYDFIEFQKRRIDREEDGE
ncbi:helix-turn-helix domain-containing protein [Pediococcus pentosaceus]|uniref:helix-turn-helix domain-containing protein n=1 Tax=Pediococcus pentosaceus TaxID=1255 RepID=UPI003593142E